MELKFENERARANIPRLQVSEHYPLIGDIYFNGAYILSASADHQDRHRPCA